MDRVSLAIWVYPVVLLVTNVAVAALIYLRRLQVGTRPSAAQ
jgi:cytochrome c-type biogenesis protein CcmH/NrfF